MTYLAIGVVVREAITDRIDYKGSQNIKNIGSSLER